MVSSQQKWSNSIWNSFQFLATTLIFIVMVFAPIQSLASQVPAAPANKLAFDTASVKPNLTIEPGRSNVPLGPGDAYAPTGGLFSASNWPLIIYISFAYKLQASQLQYLLPELPSWVTRNRFDIQARVEGNPTKDQIRLMMQSLLEDRFKLKIHQETRQVPVLALVLSKPGKTGPQLSPHKDDASCSNAPTPPPGDVAPQHSASPAAKSPAVCGSLVQMDPTSLGDLRFGARNLLMGLIANSLTGIGNLGRPVVDQTGLTGTFDFSIEWTPQPNGPPPPGTSLPADPTGPTFLEALREQLGLKLVPQTGPVDAIVIDHVEQPSEN